MNILVLNGPNLNMLGKRNPLHYGTETLTEFNQRLTQYAQTVDVCLEFFQSNCEGEIIDKLHSTESHAVIINAGAYTHYSYVIRDAIECIDVPVVGVHLSDITKREDFRKINVLADVTAQTFFGKGFDSYVEAIDFLLAHCGVVKC